jgi:hypothetical protein
MTEDGPIFRGSNIKRRMPSLLRRPTTGVLIRLHINPLHYTICAACTPRRLATAQSMFARKLAPTFALSAARRLVVCFSIASGQVCCASYAL